MTTNRSVEEGRRRRSSALRPWARPPGLALLGLALFGLIQAGCRSDGCSDCGLGRRLSDGVQALAARVTKHFDGCGGGADCGCGYGESVVDSGTPVISGGMVYPGAGTIVPAPVIEQPPTQLTPIESSSQPTNGSGASNKANASGTNRSSYTTMAPKGTTAQAQRRTADVSRALLSSPDSTASTDLFDNLPPVPVDLPEQVTKNATTTSKPTPTVAPASTTPASATPAASPTASVNPPVPIPAPSAAPETSTPTPAEKVSAAEGALDNLPLIPTPNGFQAAGIRRYASIAPSLAGGSSPSLEGLDYLKEKGCRTFVDLRKPSEVEPNFVDAVNDRNMDYLSLPILANRLEPSRLARFDNLIAHSENRPLYFCDTDGTRAGLVWYIHLRVVEQEDSQSAQVKAEEVGLTLNEMKIAESYLTTFKPKARAQTARVAANDPKQAKLEQPAPAVVVPVPAPAPQPIPAAPTAVNNPGPIPSTDPTTPMLPGEERPQADLPSTPAQDRLRDPSFWRPIAALVLTGLGVPLAYWSRSAFSLTRTNRRARASLPGTVLPASETPVESDA
jgi:protein tyrosine phosphatase (PTP) superfamily phosphohydrolase (DUF442 family)